MAEPIRFLLNGTPVAVSGLAPQTTLLEYLRDERRLTGTKEGCAEGDCGACTVILAEPAAGGGLAWQPINACIRLLPTVDGKAVYTVESLAGADGALHPVQEAMARAHGSQCGFCTPGFVMSLFGLYKSAWRPPREHVAAALSGNLCRCTGYRPILDAAQAMYALPPPTDWRGPGVGADGARQFTADEERVAVALSLLGRDAALDYVHDGQRFHAPRSEDELAARLAATPAARIVAGATDVGLWITKQHRRLDDIVHVGAIESLARIDAGADALTIGATATLAAAFAALDAEWPELAEAWQRFASVPIRHSGTLGGNVANGSPIGDSMPALIALGAAVELRRAGGTRVLPLEDLYLAYQKSARAPGEYVAAVHVPRRRAGTVLRGYKISRRHDQDISAVFACFRLDLDGDAIVAARIGAGGVAATPKRAIATEAALAGQRWNEATARAAAAVLAAEFAPITDMRASADYRRDVLGALLVRCWHETAADAPRVPTRVHEVAA